jgi:hypothetical protein
MVDPIEKRVLRHQSSFFNGLAKCDRNKQFKSMRPRTSFCEHRLAVMGKTLDFPSLL